MQNQSEAVSAEAEVTDQMIRATLRDQARTMGRIKLPKRGFTKPQLKGNGEFAKRSRTRVTTARELRTMRARWLRGAFTDEELHQTRVMLQVMNDLENPEPKKTDIASAVMGVFQRWAHG